MYPKRFIIAPHADDEIIGCYEVLIKPFEGETIVLFPNDLSMSQATKSAKLFNFQIGSTFDLGVYNSISSDLNIKFYFPDPIYELHPEHRKWGGYGEVLARMGWDVSFYVTNMNAPYIREVKNSSGKQEALNQCYPLKQTLWYSDYKYFLFEGQCKWIF